MPMASSSAAVFRKRKAAQLEANASLRADIAQKIRAGLPAYAECGGMMYLARSIRWGNASHEMAGVIPADAVMHTRPQGRGLAVLEETADAPVAGSVSGAGNDPRARVPLCQPGEPRPCLRFAYKVVRGEGLGAGRDGIVLGNLLASFCHLRATAANPWVDRFLSFVRAQRAGATQAA